MSCRGFVSALGLVAMVTVALTLSGCTELGTSPLLLALLVALGAASTGCFPTYTPCCVEPDGQTGVGRVIDGHFELEGAALSAGYMSPLPEAWRARLGGPALVGWASNYSIVSRDSVGPSLYAFDPVALVAAASPPTSIPTTMHLGYPYGDGVYLDPTALEYQCRVLADMVTTECDPGARASNLWNFLARGVYGFVVPGTSPFAVFGSIGGSETGIGYKITQDDGNLCGGPCARGADDYHNHYWFYDLDAVLAASSPSAVQPYAHGDWDVPFDGGGGNAIMGGAFAPDTGVLYLSLDAAGRVGDYDRPPVIVAFDVP